MLHSVSFKPNSIKIVLTILLTVFIFSSLVQSKRNDLMQEVICPTKNQCTGLIPSDPKIRKLQEYGQMIRMHEIYLGRHPEVPLVTLGVSYIFWSVVLQRKRNHTDEIVR